MCNYNPHRKLSLSSAEVATSNSTISLLILLALSSIPELTSVAPFYHPWAHVHAHDLFFFFAQLEPNLMCGQQQMESLLQRIHCVVQSNDLCSRHMFCFRTLQMSSTLTCNTVFPTLCQLRIYSSRGQNSQIHQIQTGLYAPPLYCDSHILYCVHYCENPIKCIR